MRFGGGRQPRGADDRLQLGTGCRGLGEDSAGLGASGLLGERSEGTRELQQPQLDLGALWRDCGQTVPQDSCAERLQDK